MAKMISAPVTEQPADPRAITCVRNLVAGEMTLKWEDGEIHLAPLAARRLSPAETATLEERLVHCQYVALVRTLARGKGLAWFVAALMVSATALMLLLVSTDGWTWPLVWLVATLAAAIALRLKFGLEAAVVGGWIRDKAALLLVLVIGFALPAASLLFATTLFSRLRPDLYGALDFPLSAVVTLRVLQVLFLGVAITFPALLYFLFDRQRAGTLRKRFVLHIFRFDPRVRTRADVDAFYGRQMEEAFGCARVDQGGSRVVVRHRTPMIVTTLVLALGWIVASINLYALDVADGAARLSIVELFQPDRSVLAFGFLGAYFFAVNSVVRSYVRGDLQPKSYSQITARVLVVVVMTALIAVTGWGDSRVVIAFAFFAGIIPDTALQLLWERLRKAFGVTGQDNVFAQNQPLTELDGIDIYERARLAGEGVENVEALAHCNVVDLLLQTRIPAPRVIDWVDQAILYLYTPSGRGEGRRALFDALRSAGVRTATDLHCAGQRARGRQQILTAVGSSLITEAELDLLLGSIADAQWMTNLLYWRQYRQPRRRFVSLDRAQLSVVPSPGRNGSSRSRSADGAPASRADVLHPA